MIAVQFAREGMRMTRGSAFGEPRFSEPRFGRGGRLMSADRLSLAIIEGILTVQSIGLQRSKCHLNCNRY